MKQKIDKNTVSITHYYISMILECAKTVHESPERTYDQINYK